MAGPAYISEGGSADGNPFLGGGASAEEPFPALNRTLALRGPNAARTALAERSIEDREHVAGQHFEIESQTEELRKVAALAAIDKERLRVSDSMEMHRQTMLASRALADLSPDDPDYQSKVLKITADNPYATKDPVINKAIEFRDHQFLQKQTARNALVQHGLNAANEYAGRYGIPVVMKDDGYTPDYAAMRKTQQAQFADQVSKAGKIDGNNIVAPDGTQVGKITINEHGDQEVTFDRPFKQAATPDTLKRFMTETTGMGVTLADFENDTFAPDPKNPGKLTKTVSGQGGTQVPLTVDANHWARLKQDYADLTGGQMTAPTTSLTDADKAALDWANANPEDPRAKQIKALHPGQ
jgi:hypothetical protein